MRVHTELSFLTSQASDESSTQLGQVAKTLLKLSMLDKLKLNPIKQTQVGFQASLACW